METNIGYKFAGLDLKQFATFADGYRSDEQDIEISCKFTFAFNFAQNLVCCSNSVLISKVGNPLIKADLDAYFALAPESVGALKENHCIVLPEGLQAQFASLTYGTMRGVIFTKTLNTQLSKIILPPNDVLSIFIHPIKFQIDK